MRFTRLYIIVALCLVALVACGQTSTIEELEVRLAKAVEDNNDLIAENVKANTENVKANATIQDLEAQLAKAVQDNDDLIAEHENQDATIGDLEARLAKAAQDNDELGGVILKHENEIALALAASDKSRPAVPVGLAQFSEEQVVSDLCYVVSATAQAISLVAGVLEPGITVERLGPILNDAMLYYEELYPHVRPIEYATLTKWTYCTVPYYDAAYHERMRQRAQDRVDALGE